MSILEDLKATFRAIGSTIGSVTTRTTELERAAIVRVCNVTAETPAANGYVYTVLRYRRSDSTLAMISTLAGYDAATDLYMQRVETYYNTSGNVLLRTMTYTLTYDDYRQPLSETLASTVLN